MAGKNINLFLMDGTMEGRVKCGLANWTGLAYKIPRDYFAQSDSIKETKNKGRRDSAAMGKGFLGELLSLTIPLHTGRKLSY